jgi:hypothetical protein
VVDAEILRRWARTVKEQLLPGLHGHQAEALAAVSLGVALSGHCDSGRVSVAVPAAAKPASVRRRVERLVANPRLRPARAMAELARSVLAPWAGLRPVLILDETPKGDGLRCMKVSLGYRKRAVPLVWECYEPRRPPLPMPALLWRLLSRAARCLPRGCEVTLLADRGLSWPSVMDCCRHLGWHYVLRLQRDTRVRLADGTERAARGLAPRRGARWLGPGVELFKKAGWRRANVVAVWERRCREPWLLASDRPASYARCRGYCKRAWCEQLHRDEKSQGPNWQRSRVEDPRRACRLLLAVALATLLAVSLGTRALKRGLRRELESGRARKLSVFQLGLRWLAAAMLRDLPLPCTLCLVPP